MPDEDVVAGGKENNKPLHYFKEKPKFEGFTPKNHVELCESLHMIDYQRGAKLAGAGSWIYCGMGARLEWALLNFFIEEHLRDGYELMLVPHMLNYECGYTAGQFPKFGDEVYWIANPTSDGQEISAADGRNRARQPAPRRDSFRGRASEEIYRLYAVLPPRSGKLPL